MDKFNLSPVIKSLGLEKSPKPVSLERGAMPSFEKQSASWGSWKVYAAFVVVALVVLYMAFRMRPSGLFGGKRGDSDDQNVPMFTLI